MEDAVYTCRRWWPDSSKLLAGDKRGACCIWDAATGNLLLDLSMEYSTFGSFLQVLLADDGIVFRLYRSTSCGTCYVYASLTAVSPGRKVADCAPNPTGERGWT
jgi:WD40 repeat protein